MSTCECEAGVFTLQQASKRSWFNIVTITWKVMDNCLFVSEYASFCHSTTNGKRNSLWIDIKVTSKTLHVLRTKSSIYTTFHVLSLPLVGLTCRMWQMTLPFSNSCKRRDFWICIWNFLYSSSCLAISARERSALSAMLKCSLVQLILHSFGHVEMSQSLQTILPSLPSWRWGPHWRHLTVIKLKTHKLACFVISLSWLRTWHLCRCTRRIACDLIFANDQWHHTHCPLLLLLCSSFLSGSSLYPTFDL